VVPLAASAIFLLLTGAALAMSWQATAGHLTYALDDPYIHMAMAKNLATHGVWGISASQFSSSSSSPVWTAGLGLVFLIAGVRDWVPFAANLVLGVVLLQVVDRQLARATGGRHTVVRLLALVAVTVVAPLPSLVFAGLEHILHAIAVLLFLDRAATLLDARDGNGASRQTRELVLLAAALPLVRFESLFLIAIAVGLLVIRRRTSLAALIAVSAALPLGAYASLSRALGWYWLPNSVILKGTRPAFGTLRDILDTFGYVAYSRLREVPAVGFMLSLVVIVFAVRAARGTRDALQWKLALVFLMTIAHMQFAQPQPFWFYRYEAYVLVAAMVVVAEAIVAHLAGTPESNAGWRANLSAASAVALLVAFSPLTERAIRAFTNIPRATTNIYEQHYQIGEFLRRFYEGRAVALNDIGLPSYAASLDTIDLVGLANMEVAKRRLRGWYAADDIEEIASAKGAQVAVVYDSWFENRIPPSWQRAGTWTIQNNVVTGGNTVTFYATTPEEAGPLRQHLREFAPELPASVGQAP
jgi:hypothetical protein